MPIPLTLEQQAIAALEAASLAIEKARQAVEKARQADQLVMDRATKTCFQTAQDVLEEVLGDFQDV